MPIQLITISREFGAGGSELAHHLGASLGWPVLDHEIVQRVAQRLRTDAATIEHFDEHPPSLLTRIATVLIVPQSDMFAFSPADVPDHERIASATTRVIEEAGASPPLVIVGHGAQCIFGGRPDALHVRVVAPVAPRVHRVMQRLAVDAPHAAALLARADRDRAAYVQRRFRSNWRDELLYDVQLNTGRIAIEQAADMVLSLVRARGVGPPIEAGRDASVEAESAEHAS